MMVNVLLFVVLSLILIIVMVNTDEFETAMQTSLSYTDRVDVKCVDIVKSIDGSYYTMTYMYEPQGVEEPYYIKYIEYDVEPDISELWVSNVDPTKVSKIPTTLTTKVAYFLNNPIFCLLEFIFILQLICGCSVCFIRGITKHYREAE